MQIKTKFLENLAVTTAKLADLAVSTAKIAADAVTGAKILLANNEWLRGRNQADNADVNIVRVDTNDDKEAAGLWKFPDAAPQTSVAPVAGDDLVNKTYADSLAGQVDGGFENLTLDSTDITNQYKDLAEEVKEDTLHLSVSGVVQTQGVDYTLSVVGSVTRITFAGDLATGGAAELVDGDSIQCRYLVA